MFDRLKTHAADLGSRRIETLFDEPGRAETFSVSALGMLFDYSKTLVDADIRAALLALVDKADVAARRDAMFGGAKINETEGRAVLHTALRAPADAVIEVDGENVVPGIHEVLTRMGGFATGIISSKL